MAVDRADVAPVIEAFLRRMKKPSEFTEDTQLHADGLGLDSLETAELSVMLEETFGVDPFTAEELPTTVGGIFEFYEVLPG
jgi:acyl carrier protein